MFIKIVDEKGRITLPQKLRNKLGMTPDTIVSLTEQDNGIMLRPEKICTNCQAEKPGNKVLDAFDRLSSAEKDAVIAHLLKNGRGSDSG